MNEFSTASPEEQKAWRNMLELVTVQMKNGYEKAKSNMNQRPSSWFAPFLSFFPSIFEWIIYYMFQSSKIGRRL